MKSAQKRYYSVKEASDIIGVSTNTVYKYLENGELKARRIGKGRFKIPIQELLPYMHIDNGNDVVNTKTMQENNYPIDSKKLYEDINNKKEEHLIGFSRNDQSIFKIFSAIVIFGLGIIYIFVNPLNLSLRSETVFGSVTNAFAGVLPYFLLSVGFVRIIGIIYSEKNILIHIIIDYITVIVLGYCSLMAFLSTSFGLFIFTMSLLGVILGGLLFGNKERYQDATYLKHFSIYSLLLVLLGGLLATFHPSMIPIQSISNLIQTNKGAFILLWFVLLVVPAVYLITPWGKVSTIKFPYFIFSSVIWLTLGIKAMFIPNWDTSLLGIMTGVFGLFLAWWLTTKIKLNKNKVVYLFFSFFWISLVILISFITIDRYKQQLEKESSNNLQSLLNDTANQINLKIEERLSILLSYSGKEDIKKILKQSDTEAAIGRAKELFEQIEYASQVLILDKEGVVIGAYPRNNLLQGSNLSSNEYFQKTISLKRGYLSGVITTGEFDKITVQTMPVFENNEAIGVLVVETRPDDYKNIFGLSENSDFDYEAIDSNEDIVFQYVTAKELSENDPYQTVSIDKNHLTITRELNQPKWKFSISTEPLEIIEKLRTPTLSFILIILLNIPFSIVAGVISSKDKNQEVGQDLSDLSKGIN